jgi:heme/copper-type cytochrome/quinol oxidase subunit 2
MTTPLPPTESVTTTPHTSNSGIVNTEFIIAMGIVAGFVMIIVVYALYTYSIRWKKASSAKKTAEKKRLENLAKVNGSDLV